MYTYRSVCNLKKSSPSGAEDAAYRVSRSHLNQPSVNGYDTGHLFECLYWGESGMWVKDESKITVFVPNGEIQCLQAED